MVATGNVDTLTVETAGTAEFDSAGLASKDATVTAVDVSDVVVNVGGTLSADTAGTATVRYLGNPEVDGDSDDGGSVAAWQE